jgi:predicted kinase
MSSVIVMVGLPGSGKSYLIDKLRLADNSLTFLYSTDSYIERCAERDNKSYTEVFELYIREATDYMNAKLRLAIESNKMVIWDQTNMNSNKRRWILSLFPDSYNKQCFAIAPPANDREWSLLYSRLGSRVGKSIPGYVIDSMISTYSEPTVEEGFSQICISSIGGGILKQIPELTQ